MPRKPKSKSGERSQPRPKHQPPPKEVVKVEVKVPKPAAPKKHTHPSARKTSASHPKLRDVNLTASSVAASAHLLQPDAYVAKSASNSGKRYPGNGEPTSTCVLRAFTTLAMPSESEALLVFYPQAQTFKYRWADDSAGVYRDLPKGLGYILQRWMIGGGSIDQNEAWPAPVDFVSGSFTGGMNIPTNLAPASGLKYTISPLSITDGLQIWNMITACNEVGTDSGERRMRYRTVAGDIFGQVTATLNTQLIVHCAQTQTGSSSVLHANFDNSHLRSNANNYDYRVVNVNSDGFNARYCGPMAPNAPYDPFHPNQVGMDADEDTTASVENKLLTDFLKCVKSDGRVDVTALADLSTRTAGRLGQEPSSVNFTDSPPDVPESIPILMFQNPATSPVDVILTCGYDIEFVPPLSAGFETRAVEPDPRWADVLTVSHAHTPFLVGPHSFSSFFSSLWGGLKSVASDVWGGVKGVVGEAGKAGLQAAQQAATSGVMQRLAPMAV